MGWRRRRRDQVVHRPRDPRGSHRRLGIRPRPGLDLSPGPHLREVLARARYACTSYYGMLVVPFVRKLLGTFDREAIMAQGCRTAAGVRADKQTWQRGGRFESR